MMLSRLIKYCALIATALSVIACVHQPGVTPPPNLRAHQQELQTINNWQLNGKLGIRTPDDSGSASLKWVQQETNYQLNLSGPLGQKRMIITGQPGKVRMEQTGEPAYEAETPEELIEEQLGWTLPVTQLAYWVRGVPAPKGRITRLEQSGDGLIALLQQGEWLITYSNYSDQTFNDKNLALPGRIIAEYQGVRLTLVIRQWQLGPSKQ